MAFGHPRMLLLSDEHANDTAVVTVKDFDGKFLTIELHVTAHLGASDVNIVESCSLELHDVSQCICVPLYASPDDHVPEAWCFVGNTVD